MRPKQSALHSAHRVQHTKYNLFSPSNGPMIDFCEPVAALSLSNRTATPPSTSSTHLGSSPFLGLPAELPVADRPARRRGCPLAGLGVGPARLPGTLVGLPRRVTPRDLVGLDVNELLVLSSFFPSLCSLP